ncbi:MAG: hypothetical protein IPK22_11355 [Verrucomicrobiaceae bacterium]|nr:hypothetical protein [Verrucomicrobiaceae bacterium]
MLTFPTSRPSMSSRQLRDLQLLRQQARRALWQGRVLQIITLALLLITLGTILNRTWPVETAEAVEQARGWMAALLAE